MEADSVTAFTDYLLKVDDINNNFNQEDESFFITDISRLEGISGVELIDNFVYESENSSNNSLYSEIIYNFYSITYSYTLNNNIVDPDIDDYLIDSDMSSIIYIGYIDNSYIDSDISDDIDIIYNYKLLDTNENSYLEISLVDLNSILEQEYELFSVNNDANIEFNEVNPLDCWMNNYDDLYQLIFVATLN